MPSRNDPATPAIAHSLGFLLREVYGQLQARVYESVAAAGHPGVRAVHSPVLRHLDPGGGRVADLARATGLAKQSIAYVVDDLVALGYLRVQPDPRDARARRVGYTAKGRVLLAALARASAEAESGLARTIGRSRLRVLRRSLEMALATGAAPGLGIARRATRGRLSRAAPAS